MPDQIDPCSGDDLKSIVAVWTEHWAASIYGQEAVSLHNHPYVVLHDLQTKYSSHVSKGSQRDNAFDNANLCS